MATPDLSFSKLVAALLTCAFALCGVSLGQEKTTVWKLEGKKSTVYLAGSVHLLRESDHPLPEAYNKVYDDSEKVYFEVDMADMDSIQAKMKMMQMSMIPNGGTVRELLSEETYAELQAYMKANDENFGEAAMMFERLTPGMLAMTITSLEAMKMGAVPDFGVEQIFDTKARADGKPVIGLETVEFQIGLFNTLSKEEQDELLKMTLLQVEETPQMLGEMIGAWKTGDAAELDALLNKYFDDDKNASLSKILLHDRNANWIPLIVKELKNPGNAMFIVGAGHLVGKNSVIEMLEKKGYQPVQLGK